MRFHLDSEAPAKRAAKSLRRELATLDVPASLPRCQDAVAAMLGYAHWRDLSANVGAAKASPFDDAALPDVEAARRRHQEAALSEALPEAAAHVPGIVLAVGATRSWNTAATGAAPPSNARADGWRVKLVRGGPEPLAWASKASPSRGDRLHTLWIWASRNRFGCAWSRDRGEPVHGAALPQGLDACPTPSFGIELLGFARPAKGTRWARDPDAVDDATAWRALEPIRSTMLGAVDPELLAVAAASGSWDLPHTFCNWYGGEGPRARARRAFALAWPCFGDAVAPCGGRAGFPEAMRAAGVDAAAEAIARALHPALRDVSAIAALRDLRAPWISDGDLAARLAALDACAPEERPRGPAEARAFAELVDDALSAAPTTVDRAAYAAALARSVPGRRWTAKRAAWRRTAQAALARVAAAGHDLGDDPEDHPDDGVGRFHARIERALDGFVSNVVEAGFALGDADVMRLHVFNRSRDAHFVPTRKLAAAVSHLVLEDVTFAEACAICERETLAAMRRHAGENPRRNPTRASVEAALDAARPNLRPRYRDIGLEDLLSVARAGVEARGGRIGGRRRA